MNVVNEAGTPLLRPKITFVKCDVSDKYIKQLEGRHIGVAYAGCNSQATAYGEYTLQSAKAGNPETLRQVTAYGEYTPDNYIIFNYYADFPGLHRFPPGEYTIEVSYSGYVSTEKVFKANNKDVDIGTVILKRQ